jgi:DedD protein
LIGALALVLAAVIGLPMLLDSQPQPVADDISIQIPSKDKAPLPAAVRPEIPAADPESDKDGEETAAAPVSQPVAPAVPAKAGSGDAHEGEAAATPRTSPSKPEPADSHAAVLKPAAKVLPHTTTKDADAARALAILDGKTNDKPAVDKAAKTDDKFVVQVVALASKAKISEVQLKLKHAGIQSYTQGVATKSGERTRIRIGPFSSREEAEKMRARVVKLGFSSGAIVPGSR